ncbi:hypothetical protein D9M68_268270 [compost metagenome]
MINFEKIENESAALSEKFKSGIIEHIVIDNFLDEHLAVALHNELPDPINEGIKKSRDYIFAKNKFEKSDLKSIGQNCSKLYGDLTSDRFQNFLKKVSGENVFVDPKFHGGGLHQGGNGSFLDMHADFNFHPINNNWFRNLNILIYLNPDWKAGYGGQLKLVNKKDGRSTQIAPIFNRCIIMFTRDYTLHGYDTINFPKGEYRRSIAAYAYTEVENNESVIRSTTWYPEQGGFLKKVIGKSWPLLVKAKSKIIKSSTARNN